MKNVGKITVNEELGATDEFIEWLESRNSSCFGFTRPVEDKSDENRCIEEILTERAGIDLDEEDIESI